MNDSFLVENQFQHRLVHKIIPSCKDAKISLHPLPRIQQRFSPTSPDIFLPLDSCSSLSQTSPFNLTHGGMQTQERRARRQTVNTLCTFFFLLLFLFEGYDTNCQNTAVNKCSMLLTVFWSKHQSGMFSKTPELALDGILAICIFRLLLLRPAL